MQSESIELGFLSIFLCLLFFIFLLVSKFSNKILMARLWIMILKNLKRFILSQFHVAEFFLASYLYSFFYFYYLLYSEILFNYLFIATGIFLISSLDDFKVKIKPITRQLCYDHYFIYFDLFFRN